MIITVPETVRTIGNMVFQNCTGLAKIEIPDTVVSIGARAFDNTAYTNRFRDREGYVIYIGNHLIVADKDLAGKYEINPGTCTIAAEAFKNCNKLTEVVIPASVLLISRHAFMGCRKLEKVTFTGASKLQVVENAAFYNCIRLSEINLPACEYVEENAFYNCTSLA